MSPCDDCGGNTYHYAGCVYYIEPIFFEPPPLPPPPQKEHHPVITPKEAAAKRSVRNSARYKELVRAIDTLLCGPPNDNNTWRYDHLPRLRDSGEFVKAIVDDYHAAGWEVSRNGESLRLWEPEDNGVRTCVCGVKFTGRASDVCSECEK